MTDEHRGRVFATMDTLSEAARPVAIAAGVSLAGFANPQVTIIASGGVLLVAALIAAVNTQRKDVEQNAIA